MDSESDVEADPPILYDSLCGKLKAAKRESAGHKDFIFSACSILSNSALFTTFLVIFLAVPVSSIVMGSLYMYNCEAEKFIPIYLVVFGSFMLIQNLSSLCQNIAKRRSRRKKDSGYGLSRKGACDSIIGCFLFAWFICGNVWVYGLMGKWSPDSEASNYCHPWLYYYTFWLITGGYIVIGSFCVMGLLIILCVVCCGIQRSTS